MESELHFDATQIKKKLKFSKLEEEIDLKFKGNKMQHDFNFKLVEELENISFLIPEGCVTHVKRKIHKLVEEVKSETN